MGEDCGSWFPRQQFDLQSPNPGFMRAPLPMGQASTFVSVLNPGSDITRAPLPMGQGSAFLSIMNPDSDIFSKNNVPLPINTFSSQLGSQVAVTPSNKPFGWFYSLPRLRQEFAPALNSVLKEKLPNEANDNCNGTSIPKTESKQAQKRFLVFDQSGDQTTLIFSSGIGAPVQYFSSWAPKTNATCNLNREVTRTMENEDHQLKPFLAHEFTEKNDIDLQSEMHEDTNELNALLYSDDDSDYSEDDEVTSTAHSPGTMTGHDKQDWFEGSTEEVASSDGSSRKRKLSDRGYDDVPSLVDTANSMKPIRGTTMYEDDAESKCSNGMNLASYRMGFDWGNKRMRKEKIRETVSILQDMIPGGKDKDSLAVLDAAIHYLKCLKQKVEDLRPNEAP